MIVGEAFRGQFPLIIVGLDVGQSPLKPIGVSRMPDYTCDVCMTINRIGDIPPGSSGFRCGGCGQIISLATGTSASARGANPEHKAQAKSLAERFWASEVSRTARIHGAVCDRCNSTLSQGNGFLTGPLSTADTTPSLFCDSCFDSQVREPWDQDFSKMSPTDATLWQLVADKQPDVSLQSNLSVQVKCPGCGKALTAPITAIGKTARCKKCDTSFKVQSMPQQVNSTAKGGTPEHSSTQLENTTVTERTLIVQSTFVATVTAYNDQVPVLAWHSGADSQNATISMVVNFLRLGVPAVQVTAEFAVSYGKAEQMLKSMALPGEVFRFSEGTSFTTITRVLNK